MSPIKTTYLSCLALALISCGSPRAEFDQAIQQKNFIPFELPMESTRVGTVLRGSAKEIYLVARPEKCFPDLSDSEALRWIQSTDLPQEYQKIEFGFNADLNNIVTSGNTILNFKANAKGVHTVQLEFQGATVEMLDESNFINFYESSMSQTCKNLLSKFPFIGQGLRVQSMRFIFKDEAGANLDLTAKLSEIVDISADVNWSLENSYTLKIETPKYIGYRMAKLDLSKPEMNIQYATNVDAQGSWLFRNIGKRKISVPTPKALVAEPLN